MENIRLSEKLTITIYGDGDMRNGAVFQDNPFNNESDLDADELSALRRVLVKPVLEDILSEIRDTVSEIRGLTPAENPQYDAGKISAYVDIGEIIRAKLKGVEA